MAYRRKNLSGSYINWVSLTYVEDRERIEHLASFLLSDKPIYTVCWCVHDKDEREEDGTFKKPHCQAVIRLPSAKTKTAFSRCFAIRERMFEPCSVGEECEDLDGALLYLIHADEKSRSLGKYQYSLDDIKGPWAPYARERIQYLLSRPKNRHDGDESADFLKILKFIEHSENLTMTNLSRWCAGNGLWAPFRRSSSIVKEILKEHNDAWYGRKRATEAEVDARMEMFTEQTTLNALRHLSSLLAQCDRPNEELQADINRREQAYEIKKRKLVDMEMLRQIKEG